MKPTTPTVEDWLAGAFAVGLVALLLLGALALGAR
jgi:hypothetical protein